MDSIFIPNFQIRKLRLRKFKGKSKDLAAGHSNGTLTPWLDLIGFIEIIHTSISGAKIISCF